MYDDIDIIEAHAYSIHNMEDIEKSCYCDCFYCTKIFRPFQIDFWIDNNNTAVCPFCCIDSVIGDCSGYHITEEFLRAMNKRWF